MKNLELSFSPTISLMFLGAILISATIGLFIHLSFQSQDEANWWLSHTKDVLNATAHLRVDLSDLESDVRGYALVPTENFPVRYSQRKQAVLNDFYHLKTLTKDGNNRNVHPLQLGQLLSQRLRIFGSILQLTQSQKMRTQQEYANRIQVLIESGNATRALLNKHLQSIETTEAELLRIRTLKLQSVDRQTRMLVYFGKITAVILLIICFLKLNSEGLRRIKAEHEQSLLNIALEKQVESLDASNHKLNTLNRELETFSYSVSHDLRSPLRSIDGFSQALLDFYSDKLDAEGQDYLGRVTS